MLDSYGNAGPASILFINWLHYNVAAESSAVVQVCRRLFREAPTYYHPLQRYDNFHSYWSYQVTFYCMSLLLYFCIVQKLAITLV